MITISAFKWVPEFAQGQVRDLRARWALEEAGLPYKARLLELATRINRTIAYYSPSGRCRSLRKTASCSSNPGPSCCISANGARCSCRRTRTDAHARRNG